MSSEKEMLQQILDRIAIQDVISSYHKAVSLHETSNLASLFTPDGWWECNGAGSFYRFEGAELGPGLAKVVANSPNLLHIHTPSSITVTGDTATAHCMMIEFGDMHDGAGYVNACGVYEDKLVKVNGQWKFKSRAFKMTQARVLQGSSPAIQR